MMKRVVVLVALVALSAPCLAQQTPALRLAEEARAQIDGLNADSAYKLLASALRLSTTDRERLRGFTLLAITELIRGNQPAARQAFERAIRIEPAMRIDSLADLSTDVQIVFAQARTAVGSIQQAERAPEPVVREALAVSVAVATDTTLSIDNPRLQIWVQSNAGGRISSSITAADLGNRVIRTDSFPTVARRISVIEWTLRGADGSLMAPGRYVLRIQATDSAGQTAPVFQRTLRIARVAVDTQAHPPALAATAFAPERDARRTAKASALVWGSSIAAMVLVTPMVMGNTTLNEGLSGDPTSYAVAGGVALASVVNFIRGGRPLVLADNVKRNQQLRDDDRQKRDGIIQANQSARARAPFRVTVETP